MRNSIKRILSVTPLILLGASSQVLARELRTPWALQWGPAHFPTCRPVDCETAWNIDAWGAGLHKESNKAFVNSFGTKTDPSLAGIIFGKNTFVGLDAFVPGTTSPANPFLAFAQITPKVDYRENTAYFGFTYEHTLGCEKRFHLGVRAIMPFRAIKTSLLDCCDLEETLDDVCRRQIENIPNSLMPSQIDTIDKCYAYRLDFLASLFEEQAGPPSLDRLVVFRDTDVNPNDITIHKISVGNTNYPVHVVQRDNGTAPEGPFCESLANVMNLPNLADNGLGLANNARAKFNNSVNYTPLGGSLAAQRNLWVVPTATPQGPMNVMNLSVNAAAIGDAIRNIIETLEGLSAVGFFNEHGISFGTQETVGIADFDTDLYGYYEFCRGLIEGIVGVRWPTGVKVKDPNNVLSIFTTGNNRHFQFRLGVLGTWEPTCWFNAKADIYYSHVFKGNERVAAPFKGATIKNIGPTTNADISWDYAVAHLDFIFMVPCNPRVGFLAGLEAYAKSKDHVSLKQSSATDFLGKTEPLDPDVLELRTKVISNKIRTEMWHQGDYWEMFGGWTHVFAGKNAPQESDWYVGFVAYF